ncbi:MAG: UDP-N-acetylglucosamine 2-epimerase (non-hydrolyzing) [Acidobacteriaceae bacterium]
MILLIVFGTRPECIKLAPIIHLAQARGFKVLTCVTGQHNEMLRQCLDVFGIQPDFDLSVMRPNQTLTGLTSRILDGMAPVLDKTRPDCVIVQGDTTTAFAAALAAFYAGVPVAHVEAGLRTYDLASPFPEEAMRQMISRIAAWNFAPTERNRSALLAEGVNSDKILVTGNTVIDALFYVRNLILQDCRPELLDLPERTAALLAESDRKLVLITGHRRESFGEGIQNICSALAALATRFPDVLFVYPVHLNPNVLAPVHRVLGQISNVHLIEPLNYYTFVYLMNRACIIVSDSGGVQEEAPSLKVPVLVTRDVTERMEVVDSGNVKLVGSDAAKITSEIAILLTDAHARRQMTLPDNPYGDGQAAQHILDFLASHVGTGASGK